MPELGPCTRSHPYTNPPNARRTLRAPLASTQVSDAFFAATTPRTVSGVHLLPPPTPNGRLGQASTSAQAAPSTTSVHMSSAATPLQATRRRRTAAAVTTGRPHIRIRRDHTTWHAAPAAKPPGNARSAHTQTPQRPSPPPSSRHPRPRPHYPTGYRCCHAFTHLPAPVPATSVCPPPPPAATTATTGAAPPPPRRHSGECLRL